MLRGVVPSRKEKLEAESIASWGENELNAEKSRWRTNAEGDRVRKRDCR